MADPAEDENVPVLVDGLPILRGRLLGLVDHRELRDDRIARLVSGAT